MKFILKERIITLGEDDYKINVVPFNHLVKLSNKGFEGICFLGTGGELKEWINGINDLLNQEGIGQGTTQDKFQGVYSTKTSGGRADLILIFKTKSAAVDIGKMAMWRLRFGDTSWLSDYVVNYKNQHESKQPNRMKLTLKEKQLVKEYAKKLQSKKLNEGSDDEYVRLIESFNAGVRKLATSARIKLEAIAKRYPEDEDEDELKDNFMENFVDISQEVENIMFEVK